MYQSIHLSTIRPFTHSSYPSIRASTHQLQLYSRVRCVGCAFISPCPSPLPPPPSPPLPTSFLPLVQPPIFAFSSKKTRVKCWKYSTGDEEGITGGADLVRFQPKQRNQTFFLIFTHDQVPEVGAVNQATSCYLYYSKPRATSWYWWWRLVAVAQCSS